MMPPRTAPTMTAVISLELWEWPFDGMVVGRAVGVGDLAGTSYLR